MKKKFSLWLNIVTICLCVCAIAIGVYAATSATLTISGQIGFQAHGITYSATAKVKGYVTNVDDASTYVENFGDPIAMSSNTIALPAMYFTDLVGETVPSIVVEISITNGSLFPIEALLSLPTDSAIQSNITFDVDNGLLELPATTANDDTDKGTITITMTLKNAETIGLQGTNNAGIAFDFSISLNKYSQIKHDTTAGYYYTNMGSTVVTKNNIQQVQPLRWYTFAKQGDDNNFATFSKETKPTAGTYYFISENALLVDSNQNGVRWNSMSDSETDNYGLDYGTAPINALVNGQGDESVYKTYDISSSLIYRSITNRDLDGEIYKYYGSSSTGQQYTTNAAINQTLWLLSKDEANNLFATDSERIANPVGGTSGAYWWLRSPYNAHQEGKTRVYYINGSGKVTFNPFFGTIYGVRPAFQITI